jgi:hypothetical protein
MSYLHRFLLLKPQREDRCAGGRGKARVLGIDATTIKLAFASPEQVEAAYERGKARMAVLKLA